MSKNYDSYYRKMTLNADQYNLTTRPDVKRLRGLQKYQYNLQHNTQQFKDTLSVDAPNSCAHGIYIKSIIQRGDSLQLGVTSSIIPSKCLLHSSRIGQ